MKKILFLLLSTIAMYGQVPADATPLENIQITNNIQDNSATKVTVQSDNNVVNWIYKDSLKKTDTDKVKNNSFVSGSTATDALNYLSANKENISNKIYDLSGGIKPPDNYPSANAVISEINNRFNGLSNNDIPRTGNENNLMPGSLSDNGLFVTSTTPIKIPNGMSSDDAVNKGQLDTKSNINSPVFTGVPQVPEPTISQSPVTKNYADNLVVGLLNDRGSYDASTNLFPTTGGSGTSGAIRKGDMWFVSVAGTLAGKSVAVGDSFRALTNTPGQTAGNWSVLEANIGYVPENQSNKSSSYILTSTTTYPDTKALVDGLATKENIFSKNTAFNKNFGTSSGTVAEGNDSRILNGQTAFGWGNHTGLYLPLTGGILTGNINLTKTLAGGIGGVFSLENPSIINNSSSEFRFAPSSSPINRYASISGVNNGNNWISLLFKTSQGGVLTNRITLDSSGDIILNGNVDLSSTVDTSTASSHYYVETATDGKVRPKTLANVRTELVTTAAIDAAKPNIALTTSPVFTGTPEAPTPIVGTNTTQIATMEAINNSLNATVNYIPKKTGVGTLGNSLLSEIDGEIYLQQTFDQKGLKIVSATDPNSNLNIYTRAVGTSYFTSTGNMVTTTTGPTSGIHFRSGSKGVIFNDTNSFNATFVAGGGKALFGKTTNDGVNVGQFEGTVSAFPAVNSNQVVVKSQLDLKADLASPVFTGTPEAPTPTTTNGIANKGYVDNATITSGTITTATNITNATLTDTSLPQNGKTLLIANGASNINYTVNGGITASFVKVGTGSITFVQGSGRTMVAANGTLVFNGAQYSTASVVSFGTTDIVYINNF